MKLLEEYNKTAVLGFGRLNPPTIGHLKLVDTIKDTASTIGGEPMLYLSHSQDSKKNPLSYEEKVKWCKKAFGDVVKESNARTIVDVIKEVYNNGYTNLVYVGGEDRIGGEEDITNVLLKYNGQPNKSGEVLYNFDSIDFINAGNRNSSSNDLSERASASLARKLVQEGNFEEFKQIVPFKEDEAEELYNVLSKELGADIEEDLLSEAPFKDVDFPKHDYLDRVATDIVSTGVKLGDHGENGIFKTDNPNAYDELMSLKDETDYKAAAKKFEEITGVKWNKIYKGTYSGHEKGQSGGEYAEPVVAYLFNHLGQEADIDDIDNKWMKSCSIVSRFIANNWNPNEYIAVHVDGLDREDVGDYAKIGKLFKSKQEAEKVLGLPKNTLIDLYTAGKDNWNKADIVLVRKGEVGNILKSLSNVKDGAEYNEILKQLSEINIGEIIPISLKGIGNRENPRMTPEGFTDSEQEYANNVTAVLPVNPLKSDDNNCSIDIYDDNGRRIQFRRQSDSYDSLSVETHASKEARGGKGISNIKRDLGLQGTSWYQKPFNSANEMLQKLNAYFDNVRMPQNLDKMINGHDSDEFAWYNRTCFRGLIYLYEAYHNKYGGDASDFFNYVYGKSASGTGAFYLIK